LKQFLPKRKSGTMRLALFQPDIPQNTGTMLRMAACLGVEVDIIGPAGFDTSDRALRRAGLDYLEHVALMQHSSFSSFEEMRAETKARLILLTTDAKQSYNAFTFQNDDILLVGRESAGVPTNVHNIATARLLVPMKSEMRSLNVAIAAAIVLGEALRQIGHFERESELPPNRTE
jgi:tRNA (cytidine/uridine-2'-O-)-methyltransferase